MTKRQRPKNRKRPRRYHHSRWSTIPDVDLPDVGSGADPTTGEPEPLTSKGQRPPKTPGEKHRHRREP